MRRAFASAVAVATVAAAWAWRAGPEVRVPAGYPVAAAIASAPARATVVLEPGVHTGFPITRAVTVRGEPGARVLGEVVITADGARLRDLVVHGEDNAIRVEEARGVVLERVQVRTAAVHGIEIAGGAARITGCSVRVLGRYAQGIEVRNGANLERTVVRGCTVAGGQEGIVSHVSRVEFRDNRVTGTTLRALAVTEMSEGIVEGNVVERVRGAGIWCGDMSHCEVRGNVVRGVAPAPEGGNSHAGVAAVAWYYSAMLLEDNAFDGPVRLALGSTRTGTSPLAIWPAGWRGAIPGIGVSALALGGALLLGAAIRSRARPRAGEPVRAGVFVVALGAFAAQSAHMLEHGVQVFQVHVADAEVRTGIAGSLFDAEWVHLAYNLAVGAFLVWFWLAWRPPASGIAGAGLLTAMVVQGYHVAEHVAKIAQHLSSGIDPAPGLLGGRAGLVWFHFGINLAVYAAVAVAVAGCARQRVQGRISPLPTW